MLNVMRKDACGGYDRPKSPRRQTRRAVEPTASTRRGSWFRLVCALLLAWPCAGISAGAAESALPQLRVSENGRFLMTAEGKPFFYLADTAWELFHRLDREQAGSYLEKRASQGFNVIQAVALAELDGLRTPNAYGHRPLIDDDPARPAVREGADNDYWDHVDWVIARAETLGLYVGLLPTWGDKWNRKWGVGGEVFTPENAHAYGRWLGQRYRQRAIVWILGGDRPIETDGHRAITRAMARGLAEGDGGRHLMTFHPPGGQSSSAWFHDDPWLAMNMHQTGHRDRGDGWLRIEADYNRKPVKPVLDGEPLYEDHPINFDPLKFGFSSDWQVRRLAWWHVLAGSCGHTYGCHNVWQMYAPGRQPVSWAHHYWYESLELWGAGDMQHVKNLMLSRPYFTRIPDQSLIASGVGEGDGHLRAARDSNGSYGLVYAPLGVKLSVDLDKLSGQQIRAWWYDPRHGTAEAIGTFDRRGVREFVPPIHGKGNDWVLVLDDASQDFPPPGKPLS